jgi:hypothetical protein
MRISHIKDQLEAIGDPVDDTELVTNTINVFPFSWDPFIRGICARTKFSNFNKLWVDCTQEESRLMSKSQKKNDDENKPHFFSSEENERRGRRFFEEI